MSCAQGVCVCERERLLLKDATGQSSASKHRVVKDWTEDRITILCKELVAMEGAGWGTLCTGYEHLSSVCSSIVGC